MNDSFGEARWFDIPDPFARDIVVSPAIPDPDDLPPSQTRARVWRLRLSAFAAALAVDATLLGFLGLRHKTHLDAWGIAVGAGFPVLAAGTVLAVLSRSASRSAGIRVALLGGALVFLATTWLVQSPGDQTIRGMLACLAQAMVMAGCTVPVVLLSLRRAFATGATWRAAAVGLAGGLLAASALRLRCSDDAFVHVLVGHGLPILVAALAAGALGSRYLRA